jgi:lipoprotein-anchoring transpeptidase ErfK/SrfK
VGSLFLGASSVQAKTIGNNGPSRRAFLLGAASFGGLALSGCSAMIGGRQMTVPNLLPAIISPYYLQIYGSMPEEKFPVPAVDLNRVDQRYLRTEVDDPTGEKPGTIVVETSARYLYLVQGNGTAIRYGIGIGRDGFTWSGRGSIGRKAQWPTWHPTSAMMQRQPETREFADGMPGGLNNPLGARAMYIYRGGVDTIYRIHGTREYWSIGKAVSSGCVRLINQDVIDLYSRVSVGTQIIVNS